MAASVVGVVVVGVVSLGGGGGEAETPPQAKAEAPSRRALDAQAIRRVRSYTDYVRAGRPLKPQVALTFDDGPGPYTPQILEILRRRQAKATFFVLGNMLDGSGGLTRKALRRGHAIGGHTFDHPRMGTLTTREQVEQLNAQELAFAEHKLRQPSLFRPPHGSFNSATLSLVRGRGLLMALWSTDTGDYENPGAEVIAARALEGARPGAVILMHDAGGDRSQTVAALPLILDGLEERGLRPVTLPTLLRNNPPSRKQPPPKSLDLAAPPPITG